MDGPHDLGGKQGFGPIETGGHAEPFAHPWEGRMWGLSRSASAPGLTIDAWRYTRELIDPLDYLSRPYFDSWAQTDLATYINAGIISLEEAASGVSASGPLGKADVLDTGQALAQDATGAWSYARDIEAPPAFAPGAAVTTKPFTQQHHTRLPAYARGKPGLIHAHHGAHILPDESAKGNEIAQHLYSVVFEAEDLWPEATGRRDRVFLDLWESYLSPPDDKAVKPLQRMDGDPVFDDLWQAQILAMADALIENGTIGAADWSEALGAALAASQSGGRPDTAATYYEAVVLALERLLAGTGTLTPGNLAQRHKAWKQAYLSTPHGEPVELGRSQPD